LVVLLLNYFAAAGAGFEGVLVFAGLAAFLFFFTCFFTTGLELSVGAGAVCPASDSPAAASVNESPSIAEVIFFMGLSGSFLRRFVIFASETIDETIINKGLIIR
jgi:hypothetical protein